MRQAPSRPLTQEFGLSTFSFTRFELISKFQLVTRYYAEWYHTKSPLDLFKLLANEFSKMNLEFVKDLPSIKDIEVVGFADPDSPFTDNDLTFMDLNAYKLNFTLGKQRPDVNITFRPKSILLTIRS
jgi:hypothetical protein